MQTFPIYVGVLWWKMVSKANISKCSNIYWTVPSQRNWVEWKKFNGKPSDTSYAYRSSIKNIKLPKQSCNSIYIFYFITNNVLSSLCVNLIEFSCCPFTWSHIQPLVIGNKKYGQHKWFEHRRLHTFTFELSMG